MDDILERRKKAKARKTNGELWKIDDRIKLDKMMVKADKDDGLFRGKGDCEQKWKSDNGEKLSPEERTPTVSSDCLLQFANIVKFKEGKLPSRVAE
ncbi:hypothetical protein RUM44_011962 [Polyplax serrata]|uniref:Uncharacterized protein n=1 Tax=Polyplax serrata TaxID=468196 RepID=A0ABR1BA02_POLSC